MTATTKIGHVTVQGIFSVSVGKHNYSVHRRVDSRWPDKVYWEVYGGGWNRNHNCEPDGATFKRVVAATKTAIAAESFPA